MPGESKSITIKSVDTKRQPWQKPNSNTFYYSVVIEEYPSEPISFVQDRDKGAPTPEVGKHYEGKVYNGDKGMKFYPAATNFKPSTNHQPYNGGSPKKEWVQPDQDAIKAQFAIKAAVQLVAAVGSDNLDMVRDIAKDLYKMVDEVKGSTSEAQSLRYESTPVTNKELSEIPF